MREKIVQAIYNAIANWADGRTQPPRFEFSEIQIGESDLVHLLDRLLHESSTVTVHATRYAWFRDRSVQIDRVEFEFAIALRACDGAISAVPTQIPIRVHRESDRRKWQEYAEQVTRDYPPPDGRGELAGRLLTAIQECDDLVPGMRVAYRILEAEKSKASLQLLNTIPAATPELKDFSEEVRNWLADVRALHAEIDQDKRETDLHKLMEQEIAKGFPLSLKKAATSDTVSHDSELPF